MDSWAVTRSVTESYKESTVVKTGALAAKRLTVIVGTSRQGLRPFPFNYFGGQKPKSIWPGQTLGRLFVRLRIALGGGFVSG